jgi:hypothetical protein
MQVTLHPDAVPSADPSAVGCDSGERRAPSRRTSEMGALMSGRRWGPADRGRRRPGPASSLPGGPLRTQVMLATLWLNEGLMWTATAVVGSWQVGWTMRLPYGDRAVGFTCAGYGFLGPIRAVPVQHAAGEAIRGILDRGAHHGL